MASTRSGSRILIVACAFAASALVAAVRTSFDRVATACTAVYQFACDFVANVPAKFAEPALELAGRPAEILQACAYALRLAKRERPRVMPGWRMCPST